MTARAPGRGHDADDRAGEQADEQLLTGGRRDDPLAPALAQLRELAATCVPAPSAALATLLAQGVTPAAACEGAGDPLDAVLASLPTDELARRYRAGRMVAAVVVAAGATVGLTGVAAANNALPEPAESVVSTVLAHLPPFHPVARRHVDTPRGAPAVPRPAAADAPGRRLSVTLPPGHRAADAPTTDTRRTERRSSASGAVPAAAAPVGRESAATARDHAQRLEAPVAAPHASTSATVRHHRHRHRHGRHHTRRTDQRRTEQRRPVEWAPPSPELSSARPTLGQ